MATEYGERIARVEENQKNMLEVQKEARADIKELIKRFDDLENVFVTRREVALIKAVIGALVAAFGIYATYMGIRT